MLTRLDITTLREASCNVCRFWPILTTS